MLMTVLDIVGEHIPSLEALNLEGNKLQSIDRLNVLNKKFSNLKILYISDNKVSIAAYDCILYLILSYNIHKFYITDQGYSSNRCN